MGEQHGYLDRWEGTSLHYTGEGQTGDQTMTHGNRTIRDSVDEDRTLRVFDGVSGTVTYMGEFALDPAEPCYTARAPETGGGPMRNVIMFRLVPVGEFAVDDAVIDLGTLVPSLGGTYVQAVEDVDTSPGVIEFPNSDAYDRGLKGHRQTQNALAAAVRDSGFVPLSPSLGDPSFDLAWWDAEESVAAEVKSLTDSNEVGQLRLGQDRYSITRIRFAESGRQCVRF